MIEAEVSDKVAKKVEELIEERFGDEDGLVFEQVRVISKVDHDGDEYLHIYVVFRRGPAVAGSVLDIEFVRACNSIFAETWSAQSAQQVVRGEIRLGRGVRRQVW